MSMSKFMTRLPVWSFVAVGALFLLGAQPAHAWQVWYQVVPPRTPMRVLIPMHPLRTVTPVEPDPVAPSLEEDRTARIAVGGGFGTMIFEGPAGGTVATDYRLHVGLEVGQAFAGLRLDLTPEGFQMVGPGAESTPATRTTASMNLGYRFLPDSVVHPVASFALETTALSTESRTAFGFGIVLRAGIELEVPVATEALSVGLDVGAHRRLVAQSGFSAPGENALSFGGYVHYRF